MHPRRWAIAFIVCASLAGQAAALDVATLFSNIGFEAGNLSGWTLTQPNTDYVVSLSPTVNPSIDPADLANNPATLNAAAGTYFTGLKRVGDTGADLKYKLAHTATAINVPTGTVFTVTVFGNRGRLEPFDTPASTGDALVRIFGWIAGTQPTVTPSTDNWSRTISWNPATQTHTFGADGTWVSQTFTFDPAAAGRDAATLKWLSISIAARNNNHDQYVAIDLGDGAVGTQPTSWSAVRGLYR